MYNCLFPPQQLNIYDINSNTQTYQLKKFQGETSRLSYETLEDDYAYSPYGQLPCLLEECRFS